MAAYRAALEVQTHERVPFEWASNANRILAARFRLRGKRESGTAYLFFFFFFFFLDT